MAKREEAGELPRIDQVVDFDGLRHGPDSLITTSVGAPSGKITPVITGATSRDPDAEEGLLMQIASRVILGSSAEAATLAPDAVGRCALAITSPPYHNAITYTSHAADRSANYRSRASTSYAGEYLDLLAGVWRAMHEMLRPGGHLVINLGTVLEDGRHIPLPQDVAQQVSDAEESWEYCRTVVWHKVTAGVRRAGSVIKLALPGYWRPNIMTEHILVFRKRGERFVPQEPIPAEWDRAIWDIAPVPPRQIDHPAPFPEELPHRFIRMMSCPGDIIVDPFNGAGATTKAAHDLGRIGVGFDIEPQYVEYARARLSHPSRVRPLQLSVEVISSDQFVPGRTKGATRHGAGLAARAKKGKGRQ